MSKSILSGSNVALVMIIYLLSGIIPLISSVHFWMRHLFFVLVLSSYLGWFYFISKEELRETGRSAYFFLYFGVVVLLFQNIFILLFHGYVSINYSITTESVDINSLVVIENMYSSLYILDILGYSLLFLYFLFLQPADSKRSFKKLGLVSIGFWIAFTAVWRVLSGFYRVTDYHDWINNDFQGTVSFLFLAASTCLILIWYSMYRLYLIRSGSQSHYLDNQILSRSGITKYLYVLLIILIVSLSLFLILVSTGLTYPFSRWETFAIAIKAIFVPIGFLTANLKIFQRYNLLF